MPSKKIYQEKKGSVRCNKAAFFKIVLCAKIYSSADYSHKRFERSHSRKPFFAIKDHLTIPNLANHFPPAGSLCVEVALGPGAPEGAAVGRVDRWMAWRSRGLALRHRKGSAKCHTLWHPTTTTTNEPSVLSPDVEPAAFSPWFWAPHRFLDHSRWF